MTEVKDIDRLMVTIGPHPLVIAPRGTEILRLETDGTVVCADAMSATEAGRVFVEALRDGWWGIVKGAREAAEKAERDRIVAWLRSNATLTQYHWGVGIIDAIERGEAK